MMLRSIRRKCPLIALSSNGGRTSTTGTTTIGASGFVPHLSTPVITRAYSTISWDSLFSSMGVKNQTPQSKGDDVVDKSTSSVQNDGDGNDEFAELGALLEVDTAPGSKLERQKNGENCLLMPKNQATIFGNANSVLGVTSNDLRIVDGSDNEKDRGRSNENYNHLFSVTIFRVPLEMSLMELRDAVSLFGEIHRANLRMQLGGFGSFYAVFKKKESKERALAAGWIIVRGQRLSFHQARTPRFVMVRISNICKETSGAAIHQMCSNSGSVTSLARTKEGAIDVLYRVEERELAQNIVNDLSKVVVDDSQWSAQLLNQQRQSSKKSDLSSEQTGISMSSIIEDLQKQHQMQKIYLDDLAHLHDAILHLREQPAEN